MMNANVVTPGHPSRAGLNQIGTGLLACSSLLDGVFIGHNDNLPRGN